MKSLFTIPPVKSEEELLARVMAEEDDGLQGIGNRVYKNMVRRYRVYVEALVVPSSPSCICLASILGRCP